MTGNRYLIASGLRALAGQAFEQGDHMLCEAAAGARRDEQDSYRLRNGLSVDGCGDSFHWPSSSGCFGSPPEAGKRATEATTSP
jgi:hypothetical protein